MSTNFTLFETSWEVTNKVGGIYTVISTKAKTLTERLGDDYVAIGPWLLGDADKELPFDEETGYDAFCEACRGLGLPVRVGRWRIPGSPLTILVEFSGLFERKDDLLAELWEDHNVDSLHGNWDYIEPVLFGIAAGRVIEQWWEEFLAPKHQRAVAQFHEWMTGAGLLYLKRRVPAIGTIFTTHATMLGRAMSTNGNSPADGLGDRSSAELAEENGVSAKHSIEGVCAREADVFTTVSEITAKEADLLHERMPEPLLPNGVDLEVVDTLAGGVDRESARSRLVEMTSRFLGTDVSDALLLATSGRYEFHNKGIDVLLESLAQIADKPGPQIVVYVLVPAGNSGVRADFRERLDGSFEDALAPGTPLGVSTHNLFDGDNDLIQECAARLGFTNESSKRIKLVHVPIYLSETDGLLGLPYEAVLRAMDLTCFPSYYEPWGYTPQESLAVGVPTVTADYAGFGRWAQSEKLDASHGITVLERVRVSYADVVDNLASTLGRLTSEYSEGELTEACRATARKTEWSDLIQNYDAAFQRANAAIDARVEQGVPLFRRTKRSVKVRDTEAENRPRLSPFTVASSLPKELAALHDLAANFWWCWDPQARSLFRELSPKSWETAGHNPVTFLRQVFGKDLEERAADKAWVRKLQSVHSRFQAAMDEPKRNCSEEYGNTTISVQHPVAYFSAEFGIHESLKIYSGGLGILAGDHLKSASDLGLPLVAVGLFYRKGYMAQRLDSHGEQNALDLDNVPGDLPLEAVKDASGAPLEVTVQLPGRSFFLRAWRVRVGRVDLYLLDADTPSNREEDRQITRNLYGGDHEMRLRQEICLGRGGARLLRRLGVEPAVFHINEGHAAFLTLERVSHLVRKQGLTFDEAREVVRASTVFTTHTPVPAGHDRFGEDLMRRYFSDAEEWVGVPWERFMKLGRASGGDEGFNMTYLACSFASIVNGVSKLHGIASRELLHEYWPNLLESEVPVGSITNGIHLPTWTDPALSAALGAEQRSVTGEDFLSVRKVLKPKALWQLREGAKGRLLEELRGHLHKSFMRRHDSPALLQRMQDGLREDALYIGFARRFAPYKRAHLTFSDSQRLRAILDSEDRPVRILVAGKAHPADQHGRDILKSIAQLARTDEFAGRVFFLEDYDMSLASALVQGVDIWLNTPTHMLEASGTSGMKASANGALNLSISDGWWDEAYNGRNGWRIGGERAYEQQELQDEFDAAALYQLLEEDVVPLFFQRNRYGVPDGWVERVLDNLETIPAVFDTNRMVSEYAEQAYFQLGQRWNELTSSLLSAPRRIAREHDRLRRGFEALRILEARVADLSDLEVGEAVDAEVKLELGDLRPEDLHVELVLGHSKGEHDLASPVHVPLEADAASPGLFCGAHQVERSGNFAYGLRVSVVSQEDPGDSLRELSRWI